MSTSEAALRTATAFQGSSDRSAVQELHLYPGFLASIRIALSNARSVKTIASVETRELGRFSGSSC